MSTCYVPKGRRGGQYEPIWNVGSAWTPPTAANEGRAYIHEMRGLNLAAIAQGMRWHHGDADADDLVQTVVIYLWFAGVELPADIHTAATFIRAWARRRGFSNNKLRRWQRERATGCGLMEHAMRTAAAPDAMRLRLDVMQVIDTIASMTPAPEVFALLFIGELELRDAAPMIGLSPNSKGRIIETRDTILRRVRNILHARAQREREVL
jgi:DNA-directed RNA polymerase specialized sigma24 family protein